MQSDISGIAQLTGCSHVLGMLVAVAAGFFAAAKIKRMGAPPLGPDELVAEVDAGRDGDVRFGRDLESF